jgi:hypothetical protein
MGGLHRASREQRSKFRFETIVRGLQDFTARDNDNIDRESGFVVTKQLANQALGAITFHGGAHFSCCCYSETGRARLSFPREHGHEASGALEACLVDEFEVGPLSDVLSGPETGHLLLV